MIFVLGSHSSSGYSMRKYTSLVERALRESGVPVRILVPPDFLSRRLDGQARKWISYVEKFAFFPILYLPVFLGSEKILITDHSDAIWAVYALRPRRIVCVVHDLFAVEAGMGHIPEVRLGLAGRIYQLLVRSGLGRVGELVAVSQYTRHRIGWVLRRKAVVLYNPLPESFREGIRSSSSTPYKKFVLIVSPAGWRKRRTAGILAWLEVRRYAAFKNTQLIIVGNPLQRDEVAKLSSETLGNIIIRPNVSEQSLRELYQAASLVIVSSKYEGFGWPVVEAQASRVPVLVAGESTLMEIGGMGVVAFRVSDSGQVQGNDWGSIVERLTQPGLKEAGLQNSMRFDWSEYKKGLQSIVSQLA